MILQFIEKSENQDVQSLIADLRSMVGGGGLKRFMTFSTSKNQGSTIS